MRYVFGDRCVDRDRMEIRAADGPVHVEPQVFDVVAMLVANRDRVVTKDELLDAVWGSRFVSEATLTSRIKSARRAIGDDGRTQAVIRTVHGRGYQWVAEVSVEPDPRPDDQPGARAHPGAAPAVALDSFFGRDRELAQLRELLGRVRLVTIVGPGGIGKTRLALEAVSDQPTAVAVVELAAVGEPDAVGEAVATALGIQTGQRADAVAACAEYLADADTLLVVDNCEHVRQPVAVLLGVLAVRCPKLRVLCTSRTPLGLPTEQVLPLGPLPLPQPGDPPARVRESPAVAMFVARARRAAAVIRDDGRSLARIGSLCRALDGMPLAIEFAAGRSAALGLDGVAERLDRRLDLLGTDHPAPHLRHSSLRATINWSYELLDPPAQALFRTVCVFPGGVRLATVEHIAPLIGIAGDPAAILAGLVRASMLTRADSPSGARFLPLETVRAFGVDQLAAAEETGAAYEAMIHWALAFVAEVDAGIHTADEPYWDDLTHRELANLRTVRRYLADHDRLDDLLALLRGLSDWALLRDASEVWRWQLELLERGREQPARIRLPALAMGAAAYWLSGRLDLAGPTAQEVCADPAASDWARAQAMNMLANDALFAGRYEEAGQQWLARLDAAGSPWHRAHSLCLAALAFGYAGALERARELARDARAEAARVGAPTLHAYADYVSGEIEHGAGSDLADEFLARAVRTAEAAGAHFVAGIAMVTLASRRASAGETAAAADLYRTLVERWLRTGTWTQLWTTLRNAADLLVGREDPTAVRIWAAARADPQAATLDEQAATRAARRRAEVVARLGPERVARLEADVVATPRARVAEEAYFALARSGEWG